MPLLAVGLVDDAADELAEDRVVLVVVRATVPLSLVEAVTEAVLFVQPAKKQ